MYGRTWFRQKTKSIQTLREMLRDREYLEWCQLSSKGIGEHIENIV